MGKDYCHICTIDRQCFLLVRVETNDLPPKVPTGLARLRTCCVRLAKVSELHILSCRGECCTYALVGLVLAELLTVALVVYHARVYLGISMIPRPSF